MAVDAAFWTTGIGSAYGSIVSGKTDIPNAGTAVQITATSTPIPGVWVSGDTNNSGVLYVGDSNVSAAGGSQQGILVVPGNQVTFIPINDLSLLYVDAESNGDDLAWAYLQPTTSV